MLGLICTLLATACLGVSAGSRAMAQGLEGHLCGVNLDANQLAAVERGIPVVKLLPSEKEREIGVFGLVRVRASRDSVLAFVLDPRRILKSTGRRFHVFANPPGADDVAGVSYDASEYRELRDCRPGNCNFKLPATAMRAFTKQVDWSAPDAKAQVDRMLREGLLRLVLNYRSRGDSSILAYDDAAGGARSNEVFGELAAQTARCADYPPELGRFLARYPAGRLEGAHDYFDWIEDRPARLRPTLAVNHIVSYVPPVRSPSAGFVVEQELYASHYVEGGFALLEVLDVPSSAGRSTYLLAVERFRFDRLPGGILNIRGRVQEHSQEMLRSDLDRLRSAIEVPAHS